jgi:hypothetical protein
LPAAPRERGRNEHHHHAINDVRRVRLLDSSVARLAFYRIRIHADRD